MVERMEEQMKQLTKAYREELTQIEVCQIYSKVHKLLSSFQTEKMVFKSLGLGFADTFLSLRMRFDAKLEWDLNKKPGIQDPDLDLCFQQAPSPLS